jgi:hypothetical protein
VSVQEIPRPAYPSPLVGTPTNLSGALTANQPLLLVTALLLLGVAVQAGLRRTRLT